MSKPFFMEWKGKKLESVSQVIDIALKLKGKEQKEFVAVKCLDDSLDDVIGRIKDLKDRGLESESRNAEKAQRQEDSMMALDSMLTGLTRFTAVSPSKAARRR